MDVLFFVQAVVSLSKDHKAIYIYKDEAMGFRSSPLSVCGTLLPESLRQTYSCNLRVLVADV